MQGGYRFIAFNSTENSNDPDIHVYGVFGIEKAPGYHAHVALVFPVTESSRLQDHIFSSTTSLSDALTKARSALESRYEGFRMKTDLP